MTRPIKILLQTTIPTTPDDWSIARFNLLAQFLREQRDERGKILFDVVSRDRDGLGAPDRVLSALDQSDFDEMWLFAVDTGEGLTAEDCDAITRFRGAGRGLMVSGRGSNMGVTRLGCHNQGAVFTGRPVTQAVFWGSARLPPPRSSDL
jgi:hypothetical protein